MEICIFQLILLHQIALYISGQFGNLFNCRLVGNQEITRSPVKQELEFCGGKITKPKLFFKKSVCIKKIEAALHLFRAVVYN